MPRLDRFWYEIDAETRGFDEGILQSGDKLKKFAEYAAGQPLVVIGALGAAAVVAGYKATQMAAAFDTSMRKVSAAAPGAAREISKVRDAIADIASVSPRAREDLEQAAILIAKVGGGTATEIAARLQEAVKIADASGADLNGTIEAMDFVMDAFGLNVQQATDALAKMFAITQGRIDMDDLFAVLQRGGTTLATLGVKAEDAATALTALVDAGVPTRQAGTVLVSILEQLSQAGKVSAAATDEQRTAAHQLLTVLGPANIAAKGFVGAIEDLSKVTGGSTEKLQAMGFNLAEVNAITRISAGTTRDARSETEKLAAAYRAVDTAATGNRTSAEALEKILKNDLQTALIDLGTQVLPLVNAELRGLVGLIDQLTGRTKNATQNAAAVTTINTIAAALDKLSPARREQELRRLGEAVQQLAGGVSGSTLFDPKRITSLGDDQVKALFRGLEVYSREFGARMSQEVRSVVGRNVQAVTEELQRRGISLSGDPMSAPPPKKTPPGGGGGGLTAEERKALADRQKAIVESARAALVQATQTLRDDLELELDKLYAEATANFTRFGQAIPPEVEAAINLLRERISRTPVVESLSAQFAQLGDQAAEAGRQFDLGFSEASADLFDKLQGIIAQTQAELDLSAENTEEHRKLVELLKKEKELRDRIAGRIADATTGTVDQAKTDEEHARRLREMAQTIESSARGALQLASAFGLVNEQTAGILEHIVQVAANIPSLVSELSKIGKEGGGASLGAIAGAALPVLGGIAAIASAVMAGSAAFDAETKRLQKENTAALRKLSDVLGEFGLAITGNDFSKGARAGNAALAAINSGAVKFEFLEKAVDLARRLDANMASLGVSMDDLRKLAGELGITLDERTAGSLVASLKELVAAIQEVELTRFAETFTGQLEALNAQFQLFDITDPIEQLKLLIQLFDNPNFGAPALRQALAGLDLSTPEGRAAAEQAIQQLFTMLQNGTLTPDQLGGLTPQQFLDQLLQTKKLLDAGQAAAGDTGTGGYNIDRTITEATGSHIAGLLTSANVFAARTADATEIVATLLRQALGGAIPSIQPPTLPTLQGGAGAGGVTIIVQIPALGVGVTAEAAHAIGGAIGKGAADALSRVLGREYSAKRLLGGDVVLNPTGVA